MGFRVVVKLSKYFTDERSSCYIYVDDLSCKSVGALEEYLREMFRLDGGLCLISDSSLLPSCEDIHLLRPDDVIKVIPLAEPFTFKLKTANAVDEIVEVIEKDVKKKKRKKNKEGNSVDVSNIDYDPEEKLAMKENMSDCHSSQDVPKLKALDNVFTAIKNIEEFHSKLYPKEDEDELESTKTKVLNALKEHLSVNVNGVSDGRIKKRKRIRIRKSKKNNQIEMLHSDSDSGKPQMNSTVLIASGKKSNHIRFNGPEKAVNILQNENIDRTPRIIRAIQTTVMSSDIELPLNVNQNGKASSVSEANDLDECKAVQPDVTSTVKSDKPLNNSEPTDLTISNLTKQLDTHSVASFPDVKQSNIMLFKTLRLNENFTPTISDYILGRVLSIDATNHSMRVSVLEGKNQCTLPSGDFAVEESDDNNSDGVFLFPWSQMIEPRIIS